ncbi:helix-turn-helix transcriptional regulator [Pendulispora rubella]|uniref:Helix-turn-helix transcriptional regulator n=1 Tax=Pendulispora rubella TaxID=2741070 RepID=A0ABZ2L5Z5_9BACT
MQRSTSRKTLGEFLRSRRERLRPEDFGIAVEGHRRTPGLRREEVAGRAGVSSDWYLRLEQGRDVTPSVSVLEALSGALRLTEVERAHLFLLARKEEPPLRPAPIEVVQAGLARALARMGGTPVFILGRRLDILAWNQEAARVIGDPGRIPAARRNLVRMSLLVPKVRAIYADWRAVAAENIAALRAAHARHPQDRSFTELIDLLHRRSATFRAQWRRHEVDERNRGRWSLRRAHGTVVHMDYDSLLTPDDRDQRLVFFTRPA